MKPTNLSREHHLKTWPKFFRQIQSGAKNFEIRKDDRGFRIGDTLKLEEFIPCELCMGSGKQQGDGDKQPCCEQPHGCYTGQWERRVIIYKTDFDQRHGRVVLGLSLAPILSKAAAARDFKFGPSPFDSLKLAPESRGDDCLDCSALGKANCPDHGTDPIPADGPLPPTTMPAPQPAEPCAQDSARRPRRAIRITFDSIEGKGVFKVKLPSGQMLMFEKPRSVVGNLEGWLAALKRPTAEEA